MRYLTGSALVLLLLCAPLKAELITLSLGAVVVPGEYLVFPLDEDRQSEGIEALSSYSSFGVEEVRQIKLENFASGEIVRMSPEAAAALGEHFFVIPHFFLRPLGTVQEVDEESWNLDRNDQRFLPLDQLQPTEPIKCCRSRRAFC